MAILQLEPEIEFTINSTYAIPRRALYLSSETVQARVTRARKGSSEWIITLEIDEGGRYPHWRVMTATQLRRAIAETSMWNRAA